MSLEPTYRLPLTIPELRAIEDCIALPESVRTKATKQLIKAVHGLVKPSHTLKEERLTSLERVKILATESEEEREERIERELEEEEKKLNEMFGL